MKINNQSGFTLLEIMLVVAIIGVLLAAAIYKMAPALDVAKGMRVKADIQSIRTSLLSYNGSNGFYPSSEQGLQALVTQAGKRTRSYFLETVNGRPAQRSMGF